MADFADLSGVKSFLQDTIERISNNMATMTDSKGHNRYASGGTAQSIGSEQPLYEVVADSKGLLINIYMPRQYDFIDKGVNGLRLNRNSPYSFRKSSPPPLDVLRKFMLNRGIVPRDKSGKRKPITEKSLNSLAWVIGRSIKINGFEGVPYYSSVVNDKWLNDLADTLIRTYGSEVLESIEVNLKEQQVG